MKALLDQICCTVGLAEGAILILVVVIVVIMVKAQSNFDQLDGR